MVPVAQKTEQLQGPDVALADPHRHVGGFQGLVHDTGQVIADRVHVNRYDQQEQHSAEDRHRQRRRAASVNVWPSPVTSGPAPQVSYRSDADD
jgi:hypothetical protein